MPAVNASRGLATDVLLSKQLLFPVPYLFITADNLSCFFLAPFLPGCKSLITQEKIVENDSFTQRVLQVIAAIPAGSVTTYGDVARLAGSPRAARQVGGLLKRLPADSRLPWHRIINRYGQISLQGDDLLRQRDALEAEGIEISDDGKVDLARYRWQW
ncbi:MGMT family protein [Mixta tenebrionis]|uniref:MGMT family protein n=1 Tax=Mixta tenebrionis TaxID=2562439 RepID=A0A506V7E1_9GAMM|nr:MGMT family protein [Mixta tenebrionis]